MKKSVLSFVALLAAGSLVLSGCNKTANNPEEGNTEIPNPAAVYCGDNGGTLDLESGICTFTDGSYCDEWEFYRGECAMGENFPEALKTSLTVEEVINLMDTNFPVSYDYSVYNTETEETLTGNNTYPPEIDHSLLIPEQATLANLELENSGIEDGMIYTLTKATLQDDTQLSILYINDPVTLDFVAANVENGNTITNYQFNYDYANIDRSGIDTEEERIAACEDRAGFYLNFGEGTFTWEDEEETGASFSRNGHVVYKKGEDTAEDDVNCFIDMVDTSVTVEFSNHIYNGELQG